MAGDPIFWGRAGVGWSRDGYIARFPLWVEERALSECEEELRQVIADVLNQHDSVTVGLKPSVVTRTETSHDAEPGELEILTARMLSPDDAQALKETVTPFLESAMQSSNRLIQIDEAAGAALREAFRQSPKTA
jgi:hypothetical protein